jgi:hypothetical protein
MNELKQLIVANLDVITFLDILGLDLSDLVEKLEEEIDENFDVLMKAVE